MLKYKKGVEYPLLLFKLSKVKMSSVLKRLTARSHKYIGLNCHLLLAGKIKQNQRRILGFMKEHIVIPLGNSHFLPKNYLK